MIANMNLNKLNFEFESRIKRIREKKLRTVKSFFYMRLDEYTEYTGKVENFLEYVI